MIPQEPSDTSRNLQGPPRTSRDVWIGLRRRVALLFLLHLPKNTWPQCPGQHFQKRVEFCTAFFLWLNLRPRSTYTSTVFNVNDIILWFMFVSCRFPDACPSHRTEYVFYCVCVCGCGCVYVCVVAWLCWLFLRKYPSRLNGLPCGWITASLCVRLTQKEGIPHALL